MVKIRMTRPRRLSRDSWVQAALDALAEGGLAAVEVVPLAKRLGATKGSFYWHFTNREELVDAALAEWERSHTTAVLAEVDAISSEAPLEQLRLLFERVVELATRDRVELALLASADHPTVRPALERVTHRRVEATTRLFQRFRLTRAEARRRALLAYSTYLGHTQLVHTTPELLPRTQPARRAYLDDVLAVLTTSPPAREADDGERYEVQPIGVVRSTLGRPADAPNQAYEGAPGALLEIDPIYRDALHRISPGDELVVLTWLHLADRDILQTHPTGDTAIPLTGVFRTRSPDRPNPIGVHRVTVTALESPTSLRVEALEAIDGTPIIDLKVAVTPLN